MSVRQSICHADKCGQPATHYPKICVPLQGYSIEGHHPLGLLLNLACCMTHAKAYDMKTFLDTPLDSYDGGDPKDLFISMNRYGQISDFTRAYVQPVPMDCEDAITIDAADQSIPYKN